MAMSGHNGNNETLIGYSNSLGLTFYDSNNNEIPITKSKIDIIIQRDSNLIKIDFDYVNATQISSDSFYLPNAFNITTTNSSIHIELQPLDQSVGYVLVMKLGSTPIINSTYSNYDSFKVICPSNLNSHLKYSMINHSFIMKIFFKKVI